MWGSGPGWRSQQRAIEELVRAETRLGPDDPRPGRPRRPALGATTVFAFVLLLVLYVLLADQPDVQPGVIDSPVPGASALEVDAGS
jgi:hypothetical protein